MNNIGVILNIFEDNKKLIPFSHVLVNDFDINACNTYEQNFKIKPVCCDIKELVGIPDCDLINHKIKNVKGVYHFR